MPLVEVLEYVYLHLCEFLFHPYMHHFFSLGNGLTNVKVPVVHTLQDLSLCEEGVTLRALSCSMMAMAA